MFKDCFLWTVVQLELSIGNFRAEYASDGGIVLAF